MLIMYYLRKGNNYLFYTLVFCFYLHGITIMSYPMNCFTINKVTLNFFNINKIYTFYATKASNYKMSIIIKNTFLEFIDYCK